jgi:cyclohexa-1,5-dienecarbonyl-CoA hydratase
MMACDLAVARADARIGQPEIQLAVFPPVAAALLPRLIGRQHAMELILTGRALTAAEARERGLLCEIWPVEGWDERVQEYMARFAALSGPVLRLTKRAVDGGFYLDPEDAMQRAESLYLNELMRLRDPHEGLAAFIDKRRPVWQEA